MAKRTLPSQDYLRQCFDYDPENGVLVWRERPLEHFLSESRAKNWNAQWAHKRAGSQGSSGYLSVSLDRVLVLNHRVVWKYLVGLEPAEIDHINGNRADNRAANLRPCSSSQNQMNRKLGGNASGFRGVRKLHRGGWEARITKNRRVTQIGSFPTFEEACAARLLAEAELFGEFAYKAE